MNKNEAHEALTKARRAVEAINGPYRETRDALAALDAAYDVVIDDEVYAHCEFCEEPIWESDQAAITGGDVAYHRECGPSPAGREGDTDGRDEAE